MRTQGKKIKEFDRLFSLEERWSGQLEEYYMSFYSRYQEKIKGTIWKNEPGAVRGMDERGYKAK